MENDGGTLTQIETSLERIEEGTYGQCEECGVKIPKTRLNAIPYANLCVRCAQQQEQRI
jgi:DnaK suppressor protein